MNTLVLDTSINVILSMAIAALFSTWIWLLKKRPGELQPVTKRMPHMDSLASSQHSAVRCPVSSVATRFNATPSVRNAARPTGSSLPSAPAATGGAVRVHGIPTWTIDTEEVQASSN